MGAYFESAEEVAWTISSTNSGNRVLEPVAASLDEGEEVAGSHATSAAGYQPGPGDTWRIRYRESAGTILRVDSSAWNLGSSVARAWTKCPCRRSCRRRALSAPGPAKELCRVADAVLSGSGSSQRRRCWAAMAARFAAASRVLESRHWTTREQQALVDALDESYLFIQGPAGTGKTWTGARLICRSGEGQALGGQATSHKAIHNWLRESSGRRSDRRLVRGSQEEHEWRRRHRVSGTVS